MVIFEVFEQAEQINVYNGGEVKSYYSGGGEFNKILDVWNETCSNARDMPAYGVSLNSETNKALKRGLWIEFCFGKTLECNEMPFNKLLAEVRADWTGFNIIRHNDDHGYDGRCFYFNLVNKNMTDLYNVLYII